MRLGFQLSAQVACHYAVLTRRARSAAARRHATCARPVFQLPTNVGGACYAHSAMAPVTSMLGVINRPYTQSEFNSILEEYQGALKRIHRRYNSILFAYILISGIVLIFRLYNVFDQYGGFYKMFIASLIVMLILQIMGQILEVRKISIQCPICRGRIPPGLMRRLLKSTKCHICDNKIIESDVNFSS